ncbi:MAG: FCD domain-containing protein [Betaproteobacteria bacterium]|nr:FCD domain-containing protein [Betaproteobacteria bacterium]
MNARFHTAIVDAARNKALAAALEFNSRLPLVAAGAIAFNTQSLDVSMNMQGVQSEHRDIVDALLRGQAGRAESLVREHAFKSREKLRARLESVRTRQQAQDVPGLRLVVGEVNLQLLFYETGSWSGFHVDRLAEFGKLA